MKKISLRTYFIVYRIVTILSIVCVTWLKLFAVDPATGFVENTSTLSTIIMYSSRLLLLLPILFWFIITIRRPAQNDFPVSYRHLPTSIFGVLTGISIMIYSVSELTTQLIHPRSAVLQNKIILLLVLVLGLLSGVSLIVGSIRPKYGVSGKPGAMLGFIPALWQLLVLLLRYNDFRAVTTVMDTLLIILFMAFAAMFLIGQSRIVFGLGIRNGQTYAIPSGLSVSLIGLTFSISNLIYYFVHGTSIVITPMGIAEQIYILCLSLYSVVFLSGFARSIRKV